MMDRVKGFETDVVFAIRDVTVKNASVVMERARRAITLDV